MSEQLLKLEEVKSRYSQKSKINWRDVCRVMLQKSLPIHPFITQFEGKAEELEKLDISLGSVKPDRSSHLPDEAEDNETLERDAAGTLRDRNSEYLIGQEYQQAEFFEQVLRQGNSQTKGRKLAIVGKSGSGKTLLLQKIAAWVLDKTEDVPIWISASEMGTGLLNPYWQEKWLKKAAKGRNTPALDWQEGFQELLASGRVWLLVDGIDEIGQDYFSGKGESLSRLLQHLGNLIDRVRIVVTCRTHTWQNNPKTLSAFDIYHTLALNYPREVRSFIERWFDPSHLPATQERTEENLGKQLCQALDRPGRERLRHWVQNPSCLGLLCRLWQQQPGELPQTQAELYGQLVEQLYQWKAGTVHATSIQQQQLNKALGKLALQAMQYTISSARLSHRFVTEVLGREAELLPTILQLGWLHPVRNDGESSNERYYAFFDTTFQAYFAASAIEDWRFFLNHSLGSEEKETQTDSSDSFSRAAYRIFDRQWKAVILLWLGRTDIKTEIKETFIQALVEFDDRCGKDNYYGKRAYLLAAAGIAEFKECTRTDEILEQLLQWGFGNFEGTKAIAASARMALEETHPSKAIEAIIALIQSTKDKQSQKQAFSCLEKIGRGNPEAIAALIGLIDTTENPLIRIQAAESLGKIDTGNVIAISSLIEQIEDNCQEETWQNALNALTKIGKNNPKAIAALIRALHTYGNFSIQRQLFQAIEVIGKANSTAIAALVQLIRTNEDEALRRQAAESLETIDPGNPTAIAILIQLLTHSNNEEVRKQAVYSLGEITPGNTEAIAALVNILNRTKDVFLRWTAISSLGKIGSGDSEAIAALEKLIRSDRDEEKLLRKDAIESLGKIDPNNPHAIAALVESLHSTDDESVRRETAESLGNLDPGNPSAIVALTQLLHISKDPFTRRQAAVSLGKIDPGNLDALKFLIELLQNNREPAIHSLAAESLGNLGIHNPAAIATLIRTIQTTQDKDTLRSAARSLGKIGSYNRDAIATLVKALRSASDESTCVQIVDSSIDILSHKQMMPVVTALRDILLEKSQDNTFAYHKLIWHCARQIPYPEFYQAWHFQTFASVAATTAKQTLTPAAPPPLTSSDFPTRLQREILKNAQLAQSVHLVCLDSSTFLEPENPAVDIYDRMLAKNCPPFEHGLPETMAKLRLYWNGLQRDYREKTFVLVFYENFSKPDAQKFSSAFLEMLAKFNGAICVVTPQSVRGVKQLSPQDSQLVQNIISWIETYQ